MRGWRLLVAISGIVVWSGLSLASAAQTASCAASPADETAVANTLRSMYAAAMTNDRTKLHAAFAPGAYMFDGGVRYDSIDSLLQMIDAYRAKGARFVWSVTQPDVHVHCNEAWIAYVNAGSVLFPGATEVTPIKWLESANLEKQDGVWKIVFFQSTRVPEETAAK